jgi:hypothetical protein
VVSKRLEMKKGNLTIGVVLAITLPRGKCCSAGIKTSWTEKGHDLKVTVGTLSALDNELRLNLLINAPSEEPVPLSWRGLIPRIFSLGSVMYPMAV